METLLAVIELFTAFSIFIFIIILCGCGDEGKQVKEGTVQDTSGRSPADGQDSMGPKGASGRGSEFGTVVELDLKKQHGGGSSIPGIPKLPPKGEEVDAPLPAGYRGGQRDPGMTAPIMNIGGAGSGRGRGDPGMTAPIMNVQSPVKKRGPRPKRVPKAGHTCPVQPADEDPTMPVEDDMMAYKMAARNRPSVPPPPYPR